MIKNRVVVAWDLVVAAISIVLFAATPVWLAMRELSQFHAIFMLIGSALAATVAIFKVQLDKEPWPIRIFESLEMKTQKITRPSITDWMQSLHWTGRPQGA